MEGPGEAEKELYILNEKARERSYRTRYSGRGEKRDYHASILFLSERDNYFDFFSPSTFIVVLGKQKHGGGFVNTVVLEVCVFVCLGENKKE